MFARHNVLTDPPFSHIDLISCRNLLIYLDPFLQQRSCACFTTRCAGGVLWLGASETIGGAGDLFEVLDAKHKIYVRKPGRSRLTIGRAGASRKVSVQVSASDHAYEHARSEDLAKEADRLLLARYAPPGVFVNADLEILQFRGDTGPYLTAAPGKASFNLLKMARQGLIVPIRAGIHRAKKAAGLVREEGVRVRSIGGYRKVVSW